MRKNERACLRLCIKNIWRNSENDQISKISQKSSEKILKAERCKNCPTDKWSDGNDEEEPHGDLKNDPREYYYK